MPLPQSHSCLVWSCCAESSLKALLANLRGKERGSRNENASNSIYFASLGILAGFLIYKSIFINILDFI
ncbi:MAG: hypothetical protein EAZ90_23500 [Oscillatoriales cyanobacterium]|nr:MAG: hypothetical protein EAZ94_31875 [Oscillatoriales cyanobacterium]TAE19233.1 MAG: hypothetical protein EAZ93_27750 [Oscillatoriales cyanobacterium]TAE39200.1 MAG: hypothetical protein EAZ90_23500 [Oscillatoriales cyanobacterium]TAE50213.1 MAG: hypothetical protein EAZ88_21040 [Oscillatoriales cyanobacterium]TAE65041.1 MAG: hypothetical protein EAZ86_25615 [Oscillatoriales cyanobacterium]